MDPSLLGEGINCISFRWRPIQYADMSQAKWRARKTENLSAARSLQVLSGQVGCWIVRFRPFLAWTLQSTG